MSSDGKKEENVWIPTTCRMCYTGCSVLVNRVNGVARRIRGNPDSPLNLGKMCTRGIAAIMTLYDPNRVRTPLKRTNPEKGIGIDPKWVEITWEEALHTVAEKFRKIREVDPKGLVLCSLDHTQLEQITLWMRVFGTPHRFAGGGGIYCGGAQHPICAWVHGAFTQEADLDHCNYLILFGTQQFSSSRMFVSRGIGWMTKARERGMKLVVVDPICNKGAEKADEWIPIRPGTDGALALGMVNVLLNDLGIYDVEFIKKYTNLPYLIGKDDLYVRDKETGKPLVWDPVDNQAKAWDSPNINDFALEGTFRVGNKEARPAFQIFKDHVKHYTPERTSEITTVPVGTIRRIAREFGEAARIGSSIAIDGKVFPYRPVGALWGKGAQGHQHALHQGMAMEALSIIVGAIEVPGGIYGGNSAGPSWGPTEDRDGLLVASSVVYPGAPPYPPHPVKAPETFDLEDLFPVGWHTYQMYVLTQLNKEKYKIPHQWEAMFLYYNNPMMNMGNPKEVAEVLKQIPFIAAHALFIDETVEFADIVFPDTFYLERFDLFPNMTWIGMPGRSPAFWQIRQPVVKPDFDARPFHDLLLELTERIGFLPDFYRAWNNKMELKEPYRLDPTRKYSFEELMDHTLKSKFGSEHNLEWFRENGFIAIPRAVEHLYWRPFYKGRIPLYMEFLKPAGEEVRRVTDEIGLHWDISDYQPLVEWKPCTAYQEKRSDFDLYATSYKAYMDTFSVTQENPWLQELATKHPWVHNVIINDETANRKGLKDGDTITIESMHGLKVKGKIRLTQGIHPEVLGIASNYGQWAKGKPIAKGKGTHDNSLLPINVEERTEWVSGNLDLCTKVRITKG